MKRRDDNRQLRPEEVDALENDSEEPGQFERASAEEIAARRIIKPKRFSTEPSDTPAKNPFNSFGSMKPTASSTSTPISNPFSGFSGLAKQPANIPKNDPIIKQTPATFSLGSLPKTSIPSTSTSSSILTNPAPSVNTSFSTATAASATATASTATAATTSSTNSKSKIERLNQSFVTWLEKQSVHHPISIWSGGLQDYIKYAKKIAEESQNSNSVSGDQSGNQITSNSNSNGVGQNSSSIGLFEPKKSDPPTIAQKIMSIPAPSTTSASVPTPTPVPAPTIQLAAKPFTGFSFSGNGSTPSLPVAPPPASAPSTTGFSFGAKSTAPTPTIGAPSVNPGVGMFGASTGFSGFGAKSSLTMPQFGSGGFNTKPKVDNDDADGGGGGGEDGEGEGEVQQLEPVEILKNENDTDEILFEIPTKLFRYDKEGSEWKDIGKGTLRVTCDSTQAIKKKRILIRNNLGKISLNTNIWKGMGIKQFGKQGIQFYVPTDKATIQLYLVKVKAEDVERTLTFLSQIEQSL